MKNIEALAAEESQGPPKPSQARNLIDLCESCELFHTSDGEAYATVPVSGHRQTLLLKSQAFKNWLHRAYYEKTKGSPSSQAFQDAIGTLFGRAQFGGTKSEVFLRVGHKKDELVIESGDDDWSVISVTECGWKSAASNYVKFRRPAGYKSLPSPERGEPMVEINELKKFLNIEEDDFKLVVAWILASFNPRGPYPVLVLYGEQGSAKSTAVKVIRDLVDPNSCNLRREPRNSDDLMVSARNNWVVAIDNMSHLPDWLSDDLCRLSTGGGLSKRQHYSDDGEIVLEAKRPIILNGINEFVARGDLADRSFLLNLPTIDKSKRKREEVFWRDFEVCKPRIFGAILSALSRAYSNKDTLILKESPRMADAWHWISAAETAFGWPVGSCLDAFNKNQLKTNEIILNSSPVYPFIRKILGSADVKSEGQWEGTAEKLLDAVNIHRETASFVDNQFFPRTPRALSDSLRRIAPALRRDGIDIEFIKTSGSGSKRLIRLRESKEKCDATVAPDAKPPLLAPPSDARVERDAEFSRLSTEGVA